MSGDAILELSGIGKSYRNYGSTWWRAAGWITGRPSHFTDHWVLRDIRLSVQPGEAIGVVGRNGAGKSTLLKIVAGTVTPTEGRVTMHGRVSAILELGMGFNPEFSGRENVIHACGLLGYDPATVAELLPRIAEFADIGTYFEQAVRTYSSGMTMRVAFAVATAVRPDILIVDEALSVGDAAFQRKSFHRIEQFLVDGTALLFVSHGIETVKRVCGRAIWLDRGRVAEQGSARAVCDAYERDALGGGSRSVPSRAPVTARIDAALVPTSDIQYGSREAEIIDVCILTADGIPANTLSEDTAFAVRFSVRFHASCRDVHFGMMIKTVEGVCVYSTNTGLSNASNVHMAGEEVTVRFELENNLIPGTYFLNCGVNHSVSGERQLLHRRVDTAQLRIVESMPSANSGLSNLRGFASVAHRSVPLEP